MKSILRYIANNLRPLLYKLECKRRKKINSKNDLLKIYRNNEILESYNEFQKALKNIKYPNNDFNKIMSLVRTDLEEYIFIIWRFIHNRKRLQAITKQDQNFRWLGATKKFFPEHPAEKEITNAIKIDTKSLFLFGVITVNKSLLLIEKYLPDKKNKQYESISSFYDYLISETSKSSICEKLKNVLFDEIKFFRGPLNIFRNKFIQHINRGYQTGFGHGWSKNDFELIFQGWKIDVDMKAKINEFRKKLQPFNIKLFDINDNRKFIQAIYDNFEKIPNNLTKKVVNLITFTGVRSLHPYKLINKIEDYYIKLFKFFVDNLDDSELIKYKKS